MKQRRTKEDHIKDCKTIGNKIEKISSKLDYYPTYRELGKIFNMSYTAIYNIIQEAIKNGWVSEEVEEHYKRSVK